MSDSGESFLQGGIENIKLIADKVWGEFDYGAEFKDVFANISRRESLISHRFATTSSADILSDLKFPRNEFPTSSTSYDNDKDDDHYNEDNDILKGEIFQLSDETGGCETYEHLHNTNVENKIESTYWEDYKAVGQGRHPETNITYNNAFDPRLSFTGLCEDQCLLDDLEQDVSVQHNVYMNVEDVADIVDEYFNKYREYLNELKGSKKQQLRIAKKILAKQPPKIHESRIKAFDVKKSYSNDDEQAMSEILGSRLVKRYWKKSYYKHRLCRDRFKGKGLQKPTDTITSTEVHTTVEDGQTGQDETDYHPPINKFPEPSRANNGFFGTTFHPSMVASESHRSIWNDIKKSSNIFPTSTAVPCPSKQEMQQEYWGDCDLKKSSLEPALKDIPREPWTKSQTDTYSNAQMADDFVRKLDVQFANSMSLDTWLCPSVPEPTREKSSLTTTDPISSNNWSGCNEKNADSFSVTSNVTLPTSNQAPRYIWTDAWSIDKLAIPSDVLQNEEDRVIQTDHLGNADKFLIDQWNVSSVDADIEKSKPTYEYGRNQESPSYHQSNSESQNPRNTSKAFSETSIVRQQGDVRSQPGAKFTRFHARDKEATKTMLRSESSHTGVTSVHGGYHADEHTQKVSPREATQRTFTEGDSLAETSKNPTRGHSEIFPRDLEKAQPPNSTASKVVNSQTSSFVPDSGRIFEPWSCNPTTSSSESKFHDALKRYGWYSDNFRDHDVTEPTYSREDKKKGLEGEHGFGQICEPSRPTKQTVSHSSTSTTKRQLFRSPSPTKRFVNTRAHLRNSISPSSSENWSRSSSISPVKHHLIHNSSLNSDLSSPKASSPDSFVHSPEPNKTASQLNAACEPFVPAHMKSQDPSPPQTPVKVMENKQKMAQSPNHEAIKRLLQSPEVLVHMLANNDAKQAFLIQQAQQQIQQQPMQSSAPQSPYRSPKQSTVSAAQPKYTVLQKPTPSIAARREVPAIAQQHPNVIRRDAVIQPPHLSVINQRPTHSQTQHCSIAHSQIPIHHIPPPFVRTSTLIPGWSCPTAPPPHQVTRPLGVNIAFAEPPRPRTVPIGHQRYGPPLITWQAIPSYNPPPTRIIHHSFINLSNVNNNCSVNYDDVSSSYNGGNDTTFGDVKVTKETSSTRGARPIRANPDNLIHISTK